ncbi:MAG: hypothetical protein Q3983_07520 [Capnocytophaga sp.]|nr:hypothetical protein [Capnocytophaga sp.]
MILKKINEKGYYIPVVFTIVLIMIFLLYINGILTNRLQSTIYIDFMSLLVGVVFICLFLMCMIFAKAFQLLIQNKKNIIQKIIFFLQSKYNQKLYKKAKQDLINLPNKENTISITINNIRKIKKQDREKGINNKQDIAERYITDTFSPYCSNEDIENISTAVKRYSNGETDFSNNHSINIENLKNLDLYHFGWNIWNHFKIGKQESIVKFLKVIFEKNLSDVEENTIKKHLKDEENKGKIKIKEDLSKDNE